MTEHESTTPENRLASCIVPDRRFYVYQYLRELESEGFASGTPYYIGKGTGKRAWTKTKHDKVRPPINRNSVIIIKSGLTSDEACVLEKSLISTHGRINIRTGCLMNMTEGGEGAVGVVLTDENIKHRREGMRRHWEQVKQEPVNEALKSVYMLDLKDTSAEVGEFGWRIKHHPSGAVGESNIHRIVAFQKLTNHGAFISWQRKVTNNAIDPQLRVMRLKPKCLKCERVVGRSDSYCGRCGASIR